MSWKHYKELIVWQKAMDLTDEIYVLVKKLPKEELFALSEQMRRSAVSVPSNIAEGHGRQTDKEYRQFLSIAKGSVCELETQLEIGLRQRYFSVEDISRASGLCNEVRKILTKLILQNTQNSKLTTQN